ncbi:hypothetical protein [Phaeobacter sp. C3_T13_0]|uniref:hypothetical protein n=1 Tax=Phaeobacter cretensis TaxID=3342641 RepID=UPI0039BC7D32
MLDLIGSATLRRLIVIPLLALLLAACSSASPHFQRQSVQRIEVGNSIFDVRLRGSLAEAVRVNPQYAPRLGGIRHRAKQAMELASGCSVRNVLGDQALLVGQLDCASRETEK